MSSLRIARAASRLRPLPVCLPAQRRSYADAVSDKIKLTLALPHQVCLLSFYCKPWYHLRQLLILSYSSQSISRQMCTFQRLTSICSLAEADVHGHRVQVNVPAESGEMGILANHVPSIEQLKPGLIEVIEESGGSKQFFRTSHKTFSKYHG